MISLGHISSRIWYSGLGSEKSINIRRDVIGYLDYQVIQWYKQVPEELKLESAGSLEVNGNESRRMQRLRVLLYLRMNQLRILIYRPVLHSSASIASEKIYAQTVVDVAKNSVRLLAKINQISDLYVTAQACFNYFLVAALAVLFLAVCHAPVDFNRQVRDEFCISLDLVSHFSTRSYISKRLWRTIRGLRRIGEKLGVMVRPTAPQSDDAHSTAAVAMAGLAGHPMEALSIYGLINDKQHDLGNSPENAVQVSHELNNLFEAVGGFGNFLVPDDGREHSTATVSGPMDSYSFSGGGMHHIPVEGLHPGILHDEGELARVVRDLF